MASKRRIRKKQCEGKRRFATQDAAISALRSLRRARSERYMENHQLTPYRCKFCRGFHFGHTPGQGKRPHAI